MYNLSKKSVEEKYEDLLFSKVMSLYAEEKSEKIFSEIENKDTDSKNIEKLFNKIERRKSIKSILKFSKNLLNFAAIVVFVAVVSVSSVVVASAEMREAFAETIYHLVFETTDRYTQISIAEKENFIDPEVFSWEGAYAPTYIPKGFEITERNYLKGRNSIVYSRGEDAFTIFQITANAKLNLDTENAEVCEEIMVNGNNGLIVIKDDCSITWNEGKTLFWVCGTIEKEELLKISEGLKPTDPHKDLVFINPEVFNWEGAYAPTYIPKGFEIGYTDIYFGSKYVDYVKGTEKIAISQMEKGSRLYLDTENADTVKDIIINNNPGIFVLKDGECSVVWSENENMFWVKGNVDPKKIIRVAEGIRPIN